MGTIATPAEQGHLPNPNLLQNLSSSMAYLQQNRHRSTQVHISAGYFFFINDSVSTFVIRILRKPVEDPARGSCEHCEKKDS